jgi:hypothetical protein
MKGARSSKVGSDAKMRSAELVLSGIHGTSTVKTSSKRPNRKTTKNFGASNNLFVPRAAFSSHEYTMQSLYDLQWTESPISFRSFSDKVGATCP